MKTLISDNKSDNLRCLIVDDEHIAISGIENYIKKVDFLSVAATALSAFSAKDILQQESIDLMFLDINMPDLTGLEFLSTLEKPPLTILTTAYAEYALEGYRLNVVDYLTKPIAFERFYNAVSKAKERFLLSNIQPVQFNNHQVYIRQGNQFRKIDVKEILYVEAMQNYLKLIFKEETLIIHQTMAHLEENFPQDMFIRCHRSFFVNISQIEAVSGGEILINGSAIPISKHRREELLNNIVYKNLISK